MNWEIREEASAASVIEAHLLADLRSLLPQGVNVPLTLAAFEPNGALVGGVTGGTSYGWLLVKVLWVAQTWRRQGLATALLTRIEQRAMALGCHGTWLDSSNLDAALWYARCGYEIFGALDNGPDRQPAGHRRVFMRKSLA